MFEIFRTNLQTQQDAAIILDLLAKQYRHAEISFDLDDCDRILRIKGGDFCCRKVIGILIKHGFECDLIA